MATKFKKVVLDSHGTKVEKTAADYKHHTHRTYEHQITNDAGRLVRIETRRYFPTKEDWLNHIERLKAQNPKHFEIIKDELEAATEAWEENEGVAQQ